MTQEVLACAQVPPEMQPVVASLRALVEACGAAMAAQPAKRREAEDNAKRVGGLFWRLNAGQGQRARAGAARRARARARRRRPGHRLPDPGLVPAVP